MHRSLDLPVLSIAIRLSFVTKVTKEYVCGGSFIGWVVLSKFFFFSLHSAHGVTYSKMS